MKKIYAYKTEVGEFYIAEHNGRFHPVFRDESLGSYATPQQAVDDLTGGHTFTPPDDVDTASLGIPEELSEWEKLHH
jgi:hypothetical protein